MMEEIMAGLDYVFAFFVVNIFLKSFRIFIYGTIFVLQIIALPINSVLYVLEYFFKIPALQNCKCRRQALKQHIE